MCIRDSYDGREELFEFVKPEDAPAIVSSLKGGACKVQRGDPKHPFFAKQVKIVRANGCLLYTSDAADERSSVDLGGRRIIKKQKKQQNKKKKENDTRSNKHTESH